MTNVNKKFNRLQILKNSVLESIQSSCLHGLTEDIDIIIGDTEILHNGEHIGTVKYQVTQKVLAGSFSGDYDYAPHGFDSDLFLDSSAVEMLYSNNGSEMPNITKSLNELLHIEESKILNYI